MKVLICVAGMPHAEATVGLGGAIARITRSSVTLLHVVRRESETGEAERVLALARQMLPGLAVKTRVRQGDPAEGILMEVREGRYDLVVVGAGREGGLAQRLLGSVALQVVRRAPASVLVARAPGPDLDRFLICTGGLDVAEPVIETGAGLAGATQAHATLLHVIAPIPSMYTGLNEIEETLSELLRTNTPIARHLRNGAEILARRQVTAELRLRYGVAADEILSEAGEGDYDLVVIGASGTAGWLRGWLLGDVTWQIADRAPCSVLIVRRRLGIPAT